jgi:hypothetical protein
MWAKKIKKAKCPTSRKLLTSREERNEPSDLAGGDAASEGLPNGVSGDDADGQVRKSEKKIQANAARQ